MTDIAPQVRANRRDLRDLKSAVSNPDANNSIMKIKADASNAPQKNGEKLMLFFLLFWFILTSFAKALDRRCLV